MFKLQGEMKIGQQCLKSLLNRLPYPSSGEGRAPIAAEEMGSVVHAAAVLVGKVQV